MKWLALVVAVLAFVGCGSDAGTQKSAATVTTVLIGPDTNGGMDAITGGTTELVGSCLGARQGSALYVVVWPHGTKVPDDSSTVNVDDETIELGDVFSGGGGFMSPPYFDELPEIPADCLEAADADEVMWVQSVDSVTHAKR